MGEEQGKAVSTCPIRFENSNSGVPMITGRKIADGSTGKGVAPGWKTPLIAALPATRTTACPGS